MATQARHEEHHKKSESHEEHEDHVKNQSNQGGGILSYLAGAAGFGGSDNKTEQDNVTDGDNQARTTRSGAQYGQGGRDNQRANEDYGSTGKYDTDNFDNKQSTEGVTAGGYSDRDIRNDDDFNRGRNQGSNLTGNQTGRSSTPSSNQGYGTERYGSQGNRGDVDRTQTTRTEGYGGEGYGGRSSGDRDTTYVGKHGASGDEGRNTGYNQGSNDQGTYNSGTVGQGSYNQGTATPGSYNQGSDAVGAYNQGTRNQNTDIGIEGRGNRQGTDNQGYSRGKEAEFSNQQTGYGNQQATGYGQEATRQNEPDNGVRGAPIEGDNVKGYAVSAPVGSGDTSNIDSSGQPSGQVSGAHMEYLPRESDNRDHTGRGTVGTTKGDGDSSFANVKRTIPGGTEHVVTKTSNSHIEHTSTTQM